MPSFSIMGFLFLRYFFSSYFIIYAIYSYDGTAVLMKQGDPEGVFGEACNSSYAI